MMNTFLKSLTVPSLTSWSKSMKKVYKIEVDCAVCAGKVEEAIKKVVGVNSCSVNFMTQKMVIDMDDESILKDVEKAAKKAESDFVIYK